MNNIDDILSRLQSQSPKLENEVEFTDWIMDAIPDKEENKNGKVIRLIQVFSSAAAILLISLFIWQNYDYDIKPKTYTEYRPNIIESPICYCTTAGQIYTYCKQKMADNQNSYKRLIKNYYENNR